MKREAQAVLLVLFGATVLRISLFSDAYVRYVRESQWPFLIAAGAVLVTLGMLSAAATVRELLRDANHAENDDPDNDHPHNDTAENDHADDGHGHDHAHGAPRIAWLLLLPVLAVFLIAPPALGSYTAEQSDNAAAARPVAADSGFPPLPAGDPLVMLLADFNVRALWDTNAPLKGRRVKLTGFVTPAKGGGWYLTRLVISCCAADAQTYKVVVHGAQTPPRDAWVEVTGVWNPNGRTGTDDPIPALDAQQVTRIPQPREPYE